VPLWRLSLGGAAGERVTSLALSPLGSPLGLARGGAERPEGEWLEGEGRGKGPASQAAAPASQALAAASYSGALCLFRRLAASAGWGPWEAVALAAAGGGPGGAAVKGAAAEEGMPAEAGAEGLVGDGLAGGEAGKGSLGDCGGHVSWEPLGSGHVAYWTPVGALDPPPFFLDWLTGFEIPYLSYLRAFFCPPFRLRNKIRYVRLFVNL